MKKIFSMLFMAAFLMAAMSASALGQSVIVAEDYRDGDFKLVYNGVAADIFVDNNDYKVVQIAASDLAKDIETVSGLKPSIKNNGRDLGAQVVIIGTIGASSLIDCLVKDKMLDVAPIKGQWETFVLTTLARPLPGVASALVIGGSDRRGTAFGVYELSQQIGVSPWYWWADVTPESKGELIIKKGFYKYGPPSVKYRGIFINDEDFGLQPWAAQTFEPETQDIGPKTYARVFELLLRLKANHLWPAMHKCTRAFNYYENNKVVADNYAIVMGSAHCEQMLRNNVDEWKRDGSGLWMYQVNRKGVLKYWEDRVSENGQYENVYTLGMRAIHDSPMYAVGTTRTLIKLYERIIKDQRDLLRKYVNPEVTHVPQIFCPYNEVLYYYRHGLNLPDDVTILWVDDNHGYIRQLSTPEEQMRSGGSGVYYHVSYLGPPHDYLWLCTTSPGLIWEEMCKAWTYNARSVWMLNVGDIKPAEIAMEFFLQMAWDIDRWDRDAAPGYLHWFAKREFGGKHAGEIADIMREYYLLNYRRRPEHMGFNMPGQKWVPVNDPEFSLVHYGDETQKRIAAFQKLEQRADELYRELPASKRDAYYQLILYPVRCASLLNQKILYAYKSRVYAGQGRASADYYATRAEDAFKGIQRETLHYNETMMGGKWKGIMSHHPKDLQVFGMPRTGKVSLSHGAKPGVSIEGQEIPLTRLGGEIPRFNRFTRRKHFIDIFNKGSQPFEWEAKPSHDWIILDKSRGELTDEERIWVDVDYERAPKGDQVQGSIDIQGAGDLYTIKLNIFNPESFELQENDSFVQDNGVVSIFAESFSSETKGKNGAEWQVISGLGRTGNAVGILPFTASSIKDTEAIRDQAPVMEYPIYIFEPGQASIIIQAIPAHPIHDGRRLCLAVSIDEEEPVVIEFKKGNEIAGITLSKDVLRATMIAHTSMHIDMGQHKLKIWGLDPSMVVDKILLDFGGLKESYLGPEETKAIK